MLKQLLGNTGISLSALGSYYGNPVRIYMPDWVSEERVKLMKMYNAEVILISKEEGGFIKAINEAKEYAKNNNAFYADQFENTDNLLAHYETTGLEIENQVKEKIGGFVSGIGTGGTLIGTSKRLKETYPDMKVYALEPDKMPLLSKNQIIGSHRIEGIGDEFIPKLVDRKLIDEVIEINDEDAINMSRLIATKLGIGVGISAGANMIASVIAKNSNKDAIVTVFPDDNKKYLSTELSRPVDLNKSFFSNKIELIEYELIR